MSKKKEYPFTSNSIRLSPRQWLTAGLLIALLFNLLPALWAKMENFKPAPDYRVPYDLSNDYWHYARYCNSVVNPEKVFLLGDSVVWGEYVKPANTLSEQLNTATQSETFVNLGINGIHPVALAGLVKYYGKAVKNQRVILHFNPLWMTSPRHDLQTTKEFRFNHTKLAPQLWPQIPCYKDPLATRLSIVVEHHLPIRSWSTHINMTYFDNNPMPVWATQNPYANPLEQLDKELPTPDPDRTRGPKPWHKRGMKPSNFDWVTPESSFQYRFFRETVDMLRDRGNDVYVLVGPYNQHMVAPEAREGYKTVLTTIKAWLDEQQVPHYIPDALASDLYGDSSHPMAEGYKQIAKDLLQQNNFKCFLDNNTQLTFR